MDISTLEDVKLLVDTFYLKVRNDKVIGPIFNDVIQDNWSSHLTTMYSFWESMLFGVRSYNGRPFPKHMNLPIDKEHFNRWLQLFKETVNEHFEGLKAEEAKLRAENIAAVFQHRLQQIHGK